MSNFPLSNFSKKSLDNNLSFNGGICCFLKIFLPSICAIVLNEVLTNQGQYPNFCHHSVSHSIVFLSPALPLPISLFSSLNSGL